jgi:hypothetical protein
MSKMVLSQLNDGDLLYIARNMRDADKEEIYATRWSDSPNQLVDDCMTVAALPTSFTVICGLDKPIAVLGAIEPWPGVWEVWLFATDDFRKIAFSMTKYVRKVFIPVLLERGMHRAQCRSIASHTGNHEWLYNMGARQDATRPYRGWGKNGEDFLMFEWHRADLLKQMEAA